MTDNADRMIARLKPDVRQGILNACVRAGQQHGGRRLTVDWSPTRTDDLMRSATGTLIGVAHATFGQADVLVVQTDDRLFAISVATIIRVRDGDHVLAGPAYKVPHQTLRRVK